MANLLITLRDSKIKLGKEFMWRIYKLKDDKEFVFCDIDNINSTITFYSNDKPRITFEMTTLLK
jgi:hypothetical protein